MTMAVVVVVPATSDSYPNVDLFRHIADPEIGVPLTKHKVHVKRRKHCPTAPLGNQSYLGSQGVRSVR